MRLIESLPTVNWYQASLSAEVALSAEAALSSQALSAEVLL